MTDPPDPSFPSFAGGRSYAFWRRCAGLPDVAPPVAVPPPAAREETAEPPAVSEPLVPAPG